MLYASGLMLGRVYRFSSDLMRETMSRRYSGTSLQHQKGLQKALQKRSTPQAPKPERDFTLEEMISVPTVLRRSGVDQDEWYRTHVLEPEAQRLEEKRASDDEYFRAVFADPDDDDKSFC
jgi:hypothetical protein